MKSNPLPVKSKPGGVQGGNDVQQLLSNLQPVPPMIKREPKFEIVDTIQNMIKKEPKFEVVDTIQNMIKQEPKFEIVDSIQNVIKEESKFEIVDAIQTMTPKVVTVKPMQTSISGIQVVPSPKSQYSCYPEVLIPKTEVLDQKLPNSTISLPPYPERVFGSSKGTQKGPKTAKSPEIPVGTTGNPFGFQASKTATLVRIEKPQGLKNNAKSNQIGECTVI